MSVSRLLKIAIAICIAIALCSAIALMVQQLQIHSAQQRHAGYSFSGDIADNPIDFDDLQARNPDIYAWLYVPGTNVNYPVLQHPSDNSFYLNNNVDQERSLEGAIYSELQNSKSFKDPVTVLYGHNIRGGLMFSTLHEFENVEFFEQHPHFYIYTPDRVLTYEIIAASGFDDRHILNTRNLANLDERISYFNSITALDNPQKNVRKAASLNPLSKIVQLSTCNYTNGNDRYVVTGVLIKDQPSR